MNGVAPLEESLDEAETELARSVHDANCVSGCVERRGHGIEESLGIEREETKRGIYK